MIIDVNAYLGHYPFRRLRYTSAAQMVEHMDSCGIDVAVVTSLHAAFYRDADQGNQELFDEIRPFSRRLVPVATVNPKYVGWKRDLERAVERGSAKAVTLLPAYHGYRLTDDHGQAALQQIGQYDLPLVLTQRLEDRRQRHPWDAAEDLTVAELSEVAVAHPALRFVLSNWAKLDGAELLAAQLRGRCLIDLARLHVLLHKDATNLIGALGVEAIAFGSHMPFDYVGPSLVKLANLQTLPVGDYQRIAWRNAARFLQIDAPE